MPERWESLIEFPGYSVSDWGHVLNDRTGFRIKATQNTRGVAMVGLMKNGIQHKRSLALLVASVFVLQDRRQMSFDTPINLNGDRMNNHYTNLAWRPLWFARKYSKQFSDGHASFNDPIVDVETGEVYPNSMSVAVTHGLLDIEIYLSMINNTYVWPTGQIFREYIER